MSSPSSAVVLAVRERFERLTLALPQIQDDVATALKAYEAQAARLASAKKEIDELTQFLNEQGDAVEAPVIGKVAMSANMQVLMRVRSLLSDGRPRPTRDIYEALLRDGQVFTAMNPAQRLSQLLSSSDWFVSDRAQGWTLAKSENPAGAGSSGATTSSQDDNQ
jgi:hypothetical protein